MALTLYRPAALFVSLRRSAVGSLGMGKLGPSKVFIKKCFLPTPLGNPKEHTHTNRFSIDSSSITGLPW